MNFTVSNYPFYSYYPSRYGAAVLAAIIYILLVVWFTQSLCIKCRPRPLVIFVFVAHLATFIELVLRATLPVNILNTKRLYIITAPFLSVPPRFLLLANYHCLVELRGKQPRRKVDRLIEIVTPVGAVIADVLLGIANQFSFNSNHLDLSFRLRQISAGLVLSLALLFYVVWYFTVSQARRLYVFQLLVVSSTCVLIEAIYIQIISIPSLFFALNQCELYYYVCHVIVTFIALITWSIFHPWRFLPPLEEAVPRDGSGNELLAPPPFI